MRVPLITSAVVFHDNGFPLRVMRLPNHGATDRLHRHEFHELVVITNGRGRHLTDNDDYVLEAGDVFLLRGQMKHGYADVDRMGLINILFKPRELGLPLADLGDIPGYQLLFRIEPRLRQQARFRDRLHLTTDKLAEAIRLAVQLEQELRVRPPGYRFTARAHLMQLIAYLSRCYASTRRTVDEPLHALGEVLSFIDRNYRDPITVPQLLKVAHMSQSTLMRTFQRVFQRSPIDYLIRVRVQKACELLADQEQRITDVALACGFNDSNYFTRQFSRVLGRSPRDYRRGLLRAARGHNGAKAGVRKVGAGKG
jgi:AraC-like DNA-binding protein